MGTRTKVLSYILWRWDTTVALNNIRNCIGENLYQVETKARGRFAGFYFSMTVWSTEKVQLLMKRDLVVMAKTFP
jgi:hypothetical protein